MLKDSTEIENEDEFEVFPYRLGIFSVSVFFFLF